MSGENSGALDLSQVPEADLQHLSAGRMSRVSESTLKRLAASPAPPLARNAPLQTPEEKFDVERGNEAFARGALRGASYGLSDLSSSLKEQGERSKKEYPKVFETGEGVGGAAVALAPIGPEALAMKGMGRLLRPLDESASYLKNALSGAVKTGTSAAAGQSVREIEPVVSGGKKIGEVAPDVAMAGLFGAGLGAPAGALYGGGSRDKALRKAVNTFDTAVPENPEVAGMQEYIEEAKKMGFNVDAPKVSTPKQLKSGDPISELPDEIDFADLDKPIAPVVKDTPPKEFRPRFRGDESKTKDILREGITGKNPAEIRVKADIRQTEIENELQPVLKRLDKSTKFKFDSRDLGEDFSNSFGDNAKSRFIGRPDARERYQNVLDEIFSRDYTPSELNQLKRDLYRISNDKAFQKDTSLGPVEQAYKDVALFSKNKIEQYAEGLSGGLGQKVRDLNKRSGAMQEFFERLGKANDEKSMMDSVTKGLRRGFYTGVVTSPAALYDQYRWVPMAAATSIGGLSGLMDYYASKVGTATKRANKLFDYSQGKPTANRLMQMLSSAAEEK